MSQGLLRRDSYEMERGAVRVGPNRYRSVALFTALALVWGTSFVAISTGLEALPPLLFAAFRYDVAGVLLFGYALVAAERWRPRGRGEWQLVAAGGTLLIGVHIACLFTGQQYVPSATAAIVLSTTPVLTPLFARVLLDERLGGRGVVGILLGLVGVVVVAGPAALVGDEGVRGVAYLFLGATSFALGSVLVARVPATMPAVPMQAWMMLLGAGLLHAVGPLVGEPLPTAVAWTPAAAASLAYLAVVAGAGGFLVYFDLLDRIGPSELSLVNYAVPAVASVAGWLALGEVLAPRAFAGFGVILLGFVLLKWKTLFTEAVRIEARLSRGHRVQNVYVTESGPVRLGRAVYRPDDRSEGTGRTNSNAAAGVVAPTDD